MDRATDDDERLDGISETRSVVDARIGTVIADTYRVVRHIGSGGSSHVFEAEHVRLGKPFAIKLLRPELDANRRTAQRFRREARAIARIKSEHIVSVIDCGELDDGSPYLVMELLEGEDLRSLLDREGSLPARRAVSLIIEACRGLSQVHAAGLVHRDLKPENLFIAKRATGEDWCKVLDFGVAKMEASVSTAQGAIIGTVRYMAPEQLVDGNSVGPATDIYALGAVLYEALTGVPLVDGNAAHEVMYRIMNVQPRPLSQLLPSLPPALAAVVDSCVHKSPAARPSSADALARALSAAPSFLRFRREVGDTSDDDAPRPASNLVSSRRPGIVLIGLVTVLGAGLTGWCLRGAPGTTRVAPQPLAPAATDVAHPVVTLSPKLEAPISTQVATMSASPSATATTLTRKRLQSEPLPAARPPALPSAPQRTRTGRFDSTNPYGE